MRFTEEQDKIFDFIRSEDGGHGIIDAVAGAGKTTTIMECAKFIKSGKAVLFCAFNTSIKDEIKAKFKEIGLTYVDVKTMHSLGLSMLNNNIEGKYIVDEDKYRKLIKSDEIQELLKPYFDRLLEINGYDPMAIVDTRQQFAISNILYHANNRLIDINQKFRATLAKDDIAAFEELVLHFGIFNETDVRKKNFKDEINTYFEAHTFVLGAGDRLAKTALLVDYTDMLYLPYKWALQPRKKYEFIFIDECQDLSKSQFEIALKYRSTTCRILAVGDPSQSIYGFTGADIGSFQRVKDNTLATQFALATCFRCSENVLNLAREIRPDIVGISGKEGNIVHMLYDDVTKISRPGDLIISRLKSPLLGLVFDFIDSNIRVQIHPDDAKEFISDIRRIFKGHELTANIQNDNYRFGELAGDVVTRWHAIFRRDGERIVNPEERAAFIEAEQENLAYKLAFLQRKHTLWHSECRSITDVIDKIKELISAKDDAVRLSTIHRAKGLENQRVFILNYDELPYSRPGHKEWEQIQEINLKYVAVTRVKSELFLVMSKGEGLPEDECL